MRKIVVVLIFAAGLFAAMALADSGVVPAGLGVIIGAVLGMLAQKYAS